MPVNNVHFALFSNWVAASMAVLTCAFPTIFRHLKLQEVLEHEVMKVSCFENTLIDLRDVSNACGACKKRGDP
jgi:hypothetical protein